MRRLHSLAVPVAATALLLPLAACGESDSSDTAAAEDCTPRLDDADLVSEGTLTMVTNATLPPMQYVDSGGDIVGMRIDLGKEIAERLCLEPQFDNVPFEAQIPGLQSGRWDMIDTGMFYTPERAATIDLVPYEVQGVSVSVPEGNPDGIASPDDLSGKTIAVEAPGYEFDTLDALNAEFRADDRPEVTLRTFHNNADAYQALSAGQVDGVAIVESVTTYYQGSGQFETAVEGMNTAPLALGFDDTQIADAVAAVMRELKQEGYLAEMFEEFNIQPYAGAIQVTTGPVSVE
jgi:polar amino acid transport system substrate-binding protein